MEKQMEVFEKIKTSNDLIRFELKNYDKIVLRKSKTFWTGYDHTMWFLDKLYGISNKERKVRYDAAFRRNVRWAAFHVDSFPKLQAKLVAAGPSLIHERDDFLVYALPEPVTSEQVKEWEHDEEVAIQDVESVLFPDRLHDREVVQTLIELQAQLTQNIKHNMPAELREPLGHSLLSRAEAVARVEIP